MLYQNGNRRLNMWQDTVIKCDTSMTCCDDCHNAQAETSFKAGMRKVIVWVKSHGLTERQIDWKSLQSDDKFTKEYMIDPEDLQDAVREWKVNEPN